MAARVCTYDTANDVMDRVYIEDLATAEDDDTMALYVSAPGYVEFFNVQAHAARHDSGGADPIEFSFLERSSGDATTHDSYTTTPHMSSTEKSYLPSSTQKAALVGSYGTPGSGNVYVTEADTRVMFMVPLGPKRDTGDATYPYYYCQDVSQSWTLYGWMAHETFPFAKCQSIYATFGAEISSTNSTYLTARARFYINGSLEATLETTSTSFTYLNSYFAYSQSSAAYIAVEVGGTNTSTTTTYQARCRGAFAWFN